MKLNVKVKKNFRLNKASRDLPEIQQIVSKLLNVRNSVGWMDEEEKKARRNEREKRKLKNF